MTWSRLHRLQCAACGHVTCGWVPNAVGKSRFGVGIHALLALLDGRFPQSTRLAAELVETTFGVGLPASTICDIEQRTSAALAEPIEVARANLAVSDVVNADETSWRVAENRAWLWRVAMERVAYYLIDRHRSGQVIRRIIGDDFNGVVVVDRRWAFVRYVIAGEMHRHQACRRRFVSDELIPMTNNLGERLIRPSVIVRGLNQGNDTAERAIFTARILTTV